MLMVAEQDGVKILPLESDLMVLATGHRAKGVQNTDSNGDGAFSNVTLELTPPQAQRIAIAGKSGELRLMLREAGTNQPFNLRTMTKQDLMLGPKRKSSGVQFIIGGKG
jgi:pilus assembly protein CpaB